MSSTTEKLAQSLDLLKQLQDNNCIAIRSKDLARVHRERLISSGFLQEVMKGWYIPSYPNEQIGDSTPWYTSFWHFSAAYLNDRFGTNWCLSPEQSILLQVGNWTVPPQLLIRSSKGSNKVTALPHNTSLFDVRYSIPDPNEIEVVQDLRVYSLASALCHCSANFFTQRPSDARAALSLVQDASDILRFLLDGGRSVIAGRLAGAFRNIGNDHVSDEIIKTMQAAFFDVRVNDPFVEMPKMLLATRDRSPYVNRMVFMWEHWREAIISIFPDPPTKQMDHTAYLEQIDELYVKDAYHSLSIEGYRVTQSLIERVRNNNWDPANNASDSEHKDALAARGYWQAFQAVKQSIQRILEGENSGAVVNDDHRDWYRALFSPSITAGILKPSDLAGYRNGPVYIRRSMHVPPSSDAIRDMMPAFFDCLSKESHPAVRIVLGHFFFVYIHPYFDGNGRIGRFVMNAMVASAGFSWVIVPVERRDEYMSCLEMASVEQNIEPFTRFLASLFDAPVKP